jgi:hypothetical protein
MAACPLIQAPVRSQDRYTHVTANNVMESKFGLNDVAYALITSFLYYQSMNAGNSETVDDT